MFDTITQTTNERTGSVSKDDSVAGRERSGSKVSESTVQQLAETLRYRAIAVSFGASPETLTAFDTAVNRQAECVKLRVMHWWAWITREDSRNSGSYGPKFSPCGQAMASIPDFAHHIATCRTCGDALNV